MKLNISKLLRSYGTIIAGLLIIIIFSILRPGSFATLSNAINISRQISLLVTIAIGATVIMAVNEFDLSIGSVASLAGVLAAQFAVSGMPIILAFVLPVIICFIVGYINGLLITKFKILSFITTLAMGQIIGGITYKITGGATVFENIPKSFKFLGSTTIGIIPLLTIIMLVFTVVFWFILTNTPFGRKVYAIGGNEAASRVSGIKVGINKQLAFAVCGAMAGLAGVLMASRLGSAHPTGGNGLFLQSYAAVFLGMTAVKEGIPNVWGTLVGAAILGIVANGLTILQVPTYMQDVITGMIIIAAIIFQKVGRDNK